MWWFLENTVGNRGFWSYQPTARRIKRKLNMKKSKNLDNSKKTKKLTNKHKLQDTQAQSISKYPHWHIYSLFINEN